MGQASIEKPCVCCRTPTFNRWMNSPVCKQCDEDYLKVPIPMGRNGYSDAIADERVSEIATMIEQGYTVTAHSTEEGVTLQWQAAD